MDNPVETFWKLRLSEVQEALEKNHFEVFRAETKADARSVVLDIIDREKPGSLSWGGSMTFTSLGLYDELKDRKDLRVLDTFAKDLSREDSVQRRREALLTDLFITGTNAVTESGQLVNLDMIGNRVAAIHFGPVSVVILVGRNKIVGDLDDAMVRIKDRVAPANVMRLEKKTPCLKTGRCHDCSSPDRICNTWTITEKSFPKQRIKIVLINEDLGL